MNTNESKERMGAALTSILQGRGWTHARFQVALEDRGLTLNPKTIDRWLKGETSPQAIHVPTIAAALNLTTDQFFDLTRSEVMQ